MELQKKDIEHIANLARLDLTEAEIEKYGSQLTDILNFVGQLQEVDTTGVAPTAQVTGMTNAMREDEVEVWEDNERQAALDEAPELEEGFIKVERVL